MSVIVVGLNHRTAPLELLERATVPHAQLPKALADLRARENLDEVVVLSTCMRTEVFASVERFHPAVQEIRNFLCELSFSAPEDLADHLSVLYDDAAIGHLFSVTAGLDSAVLGESEILGQVRGAWEVAQEESAAGPVLAGLFRHAVEVGKRVRSETAIARGTTSVSQAAVQLAAHHFGGPLTGRRILVLGAGEMGEGMAVALAGADVADIQVANRTTARAHALAQRIGGRAVALDQLADALVDVDVLLTSTGAPQPLLTVEDMEAVGVKRDRPLLIVDVAIPRDVEAGVRHLDGVTVLDLDDLRAFARTGLQARRREVSKVNNIIEEEVAQYVAEVQARQAAPTVAALHEYAEQVRTAELTRFRAKLESLDPRQRDAVEALSKGIVAKLLHEPTVHLKDAAGTPRGERLSDALRALFDLD